MPDLEKQIEKRPSAGTRPLQVRFKGWGIEGSIHPGMSDCNPEEMFPVT